MLIFLFLVLAGTVLWIRVESPTVAIRVAGSEELVFDWSKDACDPSHIPDAPVRGFRDQEGTFHLGIAHTENRMMVGPDPGDLTVDCTVVMDSGRRADPALFDDAEWLASPYTEDGRTVYALVHNEYQGHTHPGRCPTDDYEDCWYNSIGLAVSEDGGRSFSHSSPPRHMVAALPRTYRGGGGPEGLLSPSNILRHPADGFYYALVHLVDPRGSLRGTCLMRTDDLGDPRSWRGWDGSEFRVRFVDPYGSPSSDPAAHLCQPIAKAEIDEMRQSLTYNTYLDRFLLVGGASSPSGGTPGVFFSLSEDLIHWTPRQLLMEAEMTWTHACGDPDPIAYPSLIDRTSPSRSFDTTGAKADLYFTRFNLAQCEVGTDRDLVRVAVEIVK